MIKPEINEKLVLIYKLGDNEPSGTGFFITEQGHFVTALHVVGGSRFLKEDYRCKWNGDDWHIKYDESLSDSDFYLNLTHQPKNRHDLIILQIDKSNQNFRVDHFPLKFCQGDIDIFADELFYEGFDVETNQAIDEVVQYHHALASCCYHPENGTYEFEQDDKIYKGFSGSPVFIESTGEVIGVVIQREQEDHQNGVFQSVSMLLPDIQNAGPSLYRQLLVMDALYQQYRANQMRVFREKSEWPYSINMDVFIRLFDFNTYSFRDPEAVDPHEEDCIQFLHHAFEETSAVFCTGFYGMGKTTIAQYFFNNPNICTVFMSLSGVKLTNLTVEVFKKQIVDNMFEVLKETEEKVAANEYFYRNHLSEFLNHNFILFILDGIDEAIHSKTSLHDFAKLLKSLPHRFLLTSRREFYAFFDVFKRQMKKTSHLVMELQPWGSKQWNIYTDKLKETYKEKQTQVEHLLTSLNNKVYGKLPTRPLFLKMISDLVLQEEMGIKIPPKLRDNRSMLYNLYIQLKIKNDYERHNEYIFDEESFSIESFDLFRNLASVEYIASVPQKGAEELNNATGDNTDDLYEKSSFSLDDIDQACEGLKVLKSDLVQEHLIKKSTFFSMIYKSGYHQYRFSHKSFCEYLFAYNLADSIFTDSFDEKRFRELWDTYQTVEVSTHFEDEIERIKVKKNIPEAKLHEYLRKAFESVLLTQTDFLTYSELTEEILYYTGYFKIHSPGILDRLKQIIDEPTSVHRIYYRTAHISLAMVENVDYCLDYVNHLITHFFEDRSECDFTTNRDIQINYYGKADLHAKLKEDIDEEFFKTGKLEGIVPLKVFSYFTCVPFRGSEFEAGKQYLEDIQKFCEKRNFSRMLPILEKTGSIMKVVNQQGI